MKELTPELAEICGIHAGDGYLRNEGHRRELDISGSVEEIDYYNNHVKSLFEAFFNLKVNTRLFPHRNTYGFVIRDKKIIEFVHKLGFPYGSKSAVVRIPKKILESENSLLHTRFLRGLFDTDGNINFKKRYGNYIDFKKTHHVYPVITLSTTSVGLAEDIIVLLNKLTIRFSFFIETKSRKPTENPSHRIMINGVAGVEKWMQMIGMKNEIKSSRYEIWKRFGFCQPFTTFEQRKSILNGDLDIYQIGPVV